MRLYTWIGVALVFAGIACGTLRTQTLDKVPDSFPVTKTDAEWKKQLSPDSYQVLRHAGTEQAFSSSLAESTKKGTYYCAGCGQELFSSDTKFDSGTGWPSFYKPADRKAVIQRKDTSDGMVRVEVLCSKCGGHLGHVFDDGPAPTGLRYCMNGVALKFKPAPSK